MLSIQHKDKIEKDNNTSNNLFNIPDNSNEDISNQPNNVDSSSQTQQKLAKLKIQTKSDYQKINRGQAIANIKSHPLILHNSLHFRPSSLFFQYA